MDNTLNAFILPDSGRCSLATTYTPEFRSIVYSICFLANQAYD
jgi:hypothetical protein